ncbi:MAG TPA: galactoside ABC transporter permease [Firmicutes bacterium]|nr:galactoside ABC transporter permease [Bacillota bacterium]
MAEMTIKDVNARIAEVQKSLDPLYGNGALKIVDLREEISEIRRDKMISKKDKAEKVKALKAEIETAKLFEEEHREEIKGLVADGKKIVKEEFDVCYKELQKKAKEEKIAEKEEYRQKVKIEKEAFQADLASLAKDKDNLEPDVYKAKVNGLKRSHGSTLYELKSKHQKKLQTIKSDLHDVYLDKVRKLTELNGDKLTLQETLSSRWEKYVYRFSLKDFLLQNGLYIVMVAAFLICCIVSAPMGKGDLLTPDLRNIFEILNQSSPRIFLALGVAGLILLAGTDLSIGRMVGLGTMITCIILYPGENLAPVFGVHLDFTSWASPLRIVLALVLSVLFCTAFSAFAGFFTAKFKMHPFISTMATQLIIFGLLAIITDQKNTGVIDMGLKNSIAGKIPGTYFPLLLIYAIIGVVIVSFIWNRTKFGKNMYAVGGNPEAASVSGISVFWVTIGVFIMAGVLYGLGAFFEGARIGTAKFDTGTSYETDAIAACVVGGISFTGGIGKIRGAVIGAIVFTALTYALTFLGLNPYYQFVVKGIIILAAVSLDCLKYLKKR